MRDNNPVVLITGCSTGIGRACVPYLAARGWRVMATTRRVETIRDLAAEHVDVLQLDVADEAARVNAIVETLKRLGRIDALVNNAGYSQSGPLAEVTLDEMRTQFETNLFGAFRLAQLVIPPMRKQKAGRIVNVSSVVARMVFPFGGLYCGTKWAMEAMSDALRVELKPFGISVSVVEPGGVVTRFVETSDKHLARFKRDPGSAYRAYLGGTGFREALGIGNLGSSPQTIARAIHRALTDRLPRPRYQAGLDAWVMWPFLPFVPDWVKDFVIARLFGLNNKA
jgi:NAD(P)-dependent dehydrogenase (short-subunit alcohol dehydrogenase family)